jgi:hypothetical protein
MKKLEMGTQLRSQHLKRRYMRNVAFGGRMVLKFVLEVDLIHIAQDRDQWHTFVKK